MVIYIFVNVNRGIQMSTPVNMEEGGGQKYPKSCQRSSGIFRVLSNCFALSMISLKVNIILNASFIKNSLSLSSKIEKLLCQYWPWSWFQRILRYSMQMNNAIKFVVWTSVARFFFHLCAHNFLRNASKWLSKRPKDYQNE